MHNNPPMRPHKFINTFLELLTKLKDQNTISTGDLNLNLLNYNINSETHFLLNGDFKNNFPPQITVATIVKKNSPTLIDNILINKEEAKGTSALATVKNSMVNTIFPIYPIVKLLGFDLTVQK